MTDSRAVIVGLDDDTRKENRVGFERDALAAWTEYQETGLHATADEVDDWLRRLEAGEAASPPQCPS